MKYLASLFLMLLLTGCFGPTKLDTTTEETLKSSLQDIRDELSPAEQTKLAKAVGYFSMGGMEGLGKILGSAFTGDDIDPEQMVHDNLSKLDGLTGQEILARYDEAVTADEIELRKKQALEDARQADLELIRQTVANIKESLELKQYNTAERLAETLKETDAGRDRYGEVVESIAEVKTAEQLRKEKKAYVNKIQVTEFAA